MPCSTFYPRVRLPIGTPKPCGTGALGKSWHVHGRKELTVGLQGGSRLSAIMALLAPRNFAGEAAYRIARGAKHSWIDYRGTDTRLTDPVVF